MTAQTQPDAHVGPHDPSITPPDLDEINTHAQQGWNWFTKFLFWNVVTTVGALLIVGLLTVWS
jgi:hypothetical protein